MLHKVHINIGSNLGDRMQNIDRAIAALAQLSAEGIVCSPPFHSRPWGYESDNDFVNRGVTFSTPLPPDILLSRCQRIESEISSPSTLSSSPSPNPPALSHHNPDNFPGVSHRNPDGSYADRFIDIDIIAIDSLVIDTPSLSVPHPRMHLREFVLLPLAQTWPDWLHPLYNKTALQLLHDLSSTPPPHAADSPNRKITAPLSHKKQI